MPEAKWQPNLLIAAARFLYGDPDDARRLVELTRAHPDDVASVIATRSTQTNEPARCAVLLPALARLPQPLALLEVGSAAGLCLLPDRYAYAYGTTRIGPAVTTAARAPVFACRANPATPLPTRNVTVTWRAGLDLHPVDLSDPVEGRWLEALVWPGQPERLAGLRAACDVARLDPPRVYAGDLRTDLAGLAAQAPGDATLVVFHTAVLAYVADEAERTAFGQTVGDLGAVWIANERPGYVFADSHAAPGSPDPTAFQLSVDGVPVAWTDPHGRWIDWHPQAS